ncbi:MAG: class I SAM-dependent methyltransferase [Acetobacterium sp.]|uniref:class I SAM-dependent methyltransferase n=1 Tax=Acetobacterium sp. TaxID=1872094 RepID=UPI003241DC3E
MNFKCVNCGSNGYFEVAKKCRDSEEFKILRCKKCNLVQLDHMPEILDDQNFYDADQQVKNCISDLTLQQMKTNAKEDNHRRYEMIKPHCSAEMKLLEIGCGYGFFLELLQAEGIYAEGIEIGEERRRIANKRCNNRVQAINLLADKTLEHRDKFDIVCLFQVLEHISNPVIFLKNINRLFLKDSSLVFIEIPNADDQMLNQSRGYFDFYWQRAHLMYYNKQTVKMILEKAGYYIEDIFGIQRYGLENSFNWIINQVPQLKKPAYHSSGGIKWLEKYYKDTIEENLTADTLIIIARKDSSGQLGLDR